jgi:hypothetical protein
MAGLELAIFGSTVRREMAGSEAGHDDEASVNTRRNLRPLAQYVMAAGGECIHSVPAHPPSQCGVPPIRGIA